MDKLKIKAELQEAFRDETVSYNEKISILNKSIKIYKVMKFLTKELTIFIYSMIPTLFFIGYFFSMTNTNFATYVSFILLCTHFLIYKLIFKMWLFKDSVSLNKEASYTLEVLREIKQKDFK